jgi:hypothetical protein
MPLTVLISPRLWSKIWSVSAKFLSPRASLYQLASGPFYQALVCINRASISPKLRSVSSIVSSVSITLILFPTPYTAYKLTICWRDLPSSGSHQSFTFLCTQTPIWFVSIIFPVFTSLSWSVWYFLICINLSLFSYEPVIVIWHDVSTSYYYCISTVLLTINLPVVYMGRDVLIWMRGNP